MHFSRLRKNSPALPIQNGMSIADIINANMRRAQAFFSLAYPIIIGASVNGDKGVKMRRPQLMADANV